MYLRLRQFALLAILLLVWTIMSRAQTQPSAALRMTPSLFGGASGVYTGLQSGKNLSIASGFDITFYPRSRFQPALEFRNTYPIHTGRVDSIRNNLVGLRVGLTLGRFCPYGDFLAGRGETTYWSGGFKAPNKPTIYTKSSSNIFGGGGGVDLMVNSQFALKLDLQLEHYTSPVTTSGTLLSEVGSVAIVYRIPFGTGRRKTKSR